MKKIAVVFALLLALVLLFSACGETQPNEPTPNEHTHTAGEWVLDVEPTCTQDGSRHRSCSTCGETMETETLPATGHIEVADAEVKPTCTEPGMTAGSHCSTCGEVLVAQQEIPAGHSWDEGNLVKRPTATAPGEIIYTCTRCEVTRSVTLPATGEILYGEIETYLRVNEGGLEDENGEYLLFGFYPQSEVTDGELTAVLNQKAGDLPTAEAPQNWISYEYYSGGETADEMWYQDISCNDQLYRGVYFTSYRPYNVPDTSSPENSNQDENGYTVGNVYWFRYDPLKWRILSEENGKALLLCESIVDSQQYFSSDSATRIIRGALVYPNNYQHSDIRAWLNDVFYRAAFSEGQQNCIVQEPVDNSAESTADSENKLPKATLYAGEETEDRIFLLSEQDVTNSAYGFASDCDAPDPARIKQVTDYAKAQGAYQTDDIGWWWLRSPYATSAANARHIRHFGGASSTTTVDGTDSGVVPALWIIL